MRRLNIETLLRANLVDLRRRCEHGARVHIKAVDALPDIENDPETLLQIFVSLAQRACEVCERTERVTYTFTMVELDEATLLDCIYATAPEAGIYTCTELSYLGEPLEVLGTSPTFEEIDSSDDPLMKTLAAAMRDTSAVIRVSSESDNQVRVALMFPPVKDRKRVIIPDAGKDTDQVSVLVVDDEEFVLVMVKTVLKNAGFRVLTAEDGAAGIQAYREASDEIGAVILDMMLPVMSGEEVHTEIRKISPDVPILVSSGFSSTAMDGSMQECPDTHFLQKPYQPDLLVKMLQGIISKKR